MISLESTFDISANKYRNYCTLSSGVHQEALDTEWIGWHEAGVGFKVQPLTGYGKVAPYFKKYVQGKEGDKFSFCSTNSGSLSMSISSEGVSKLFFSRGANEYSMSFSGNDAVLFNVGVLEYKKDAVQIYYVKDSSLKFRDERDGFLQENDLGVSGINRLLAVQVFDFLENRLEFITLKNNEQVLFSSAPSSGCRPYTGVFMDFSKAYCIIDDKTRSVFSSDDLASFTLA